LQVSQKAELSAFRGFLSSGSLGRPSPIPTIRAGARSGVESATKSS
jgi:hypothetical protein